MGNSYHLDMALVETAQAQKEVTVNEALVRIDAILNTGALGKTVATPPISAIQGDVYIVADAATDAWAGHEDEIAYYDGIWRFIIPREGIKLWVVDEKRSYIYSGAQWKAAGGVNQDSGEFWRMERLEISQTGLSGASVTTALQIPDRAVVFAVHARVTSAITGASSFSVGDGVTVGKFGAGIGVGIDSTNIGVVTPMPYFSPTDVVITSSGGNFTGGDVTLILHYMAFRGGWSW